MKTSQFLRSIVCRHGTTETQRTIQITTNTMNLTTTFRFLTAVLLANETFAVNVRSIYHRKLALPVIAGFEPSSDVTDLSRIDLDQRAMEVQNGLFNSAGFTNGRKIYTSGGNSESFAVLTLSGSLTATIPVGIVVTGLNSAGGVVTGVTYEVASIGTSILKVRYNVGPDIVPCAVGGLTVTNTTGCLVATGTITVGGTASVGYSYNVATGNQNGRSMKKFITDANVKLRVNENISNEFYSDFQKFVDYYGGTDYTDKIVNAGFDATSITLGGKVFDFSAYDFDPRAEIIKKSVHYQLYPMYVLRHLEVALEKCNATLKAESLRALDEAVAIYAGSLEGTAGNGTGSLLLVHARRRCGGYKTCGSTGSETSGNAKVNIEIFANFTQMKARLDTGNCAAALMNKQDIASTMFVPFIQGALRYGYLQSPPGTSKTPKAEAEGAAFVMAVLPIVAKCNAAAAATIYNEMKPNSGSTADFTAVKAAFESTYPCMGIICADVGGFYDNTNAKYLDGAGPCLDPKPITRTPTRAPIIPAAPGTPTVAPVTDTPVTAAPVTNAPVVNDDDEPRRGFFRRLWNWMKHLFGF